MAEEESKFDDDAGGALAAPVVTSTTAPTTTAVAASASSPVTATADATELDSDEEEEAEQKRRAVATYKKGLLYYKRTDNSLTRRLDAANAKMKDPTQIILPGGKICLGTPPTNRFSSSAADEEERSVLDSASMVVFSQAGLDQLNRQGLFAFLLLMLMPADLVVVLVTHFKGSGDDEYEDNTDSTMRSVSLACTLLTLALGFGGANAANTRLMTLFVCVYYIDAMINLMRVYTTLQFVHFVLQLLICYVMTQYKNTHVASWFMPQS